MNQTTAATQAAVSGPAGQAMAEPDVSGADRSAAGTPEHGETVELDTIEPPRQQWADVEEVIANMFRMNADVTAERWFSMQGSMSSGCLNMRRLICWAE